MNSIELVSFEQDIADIFQRGEIKAPIHLSGGGEDALIEIFKSIKPDDWVFGTHRSHYHALLKGIPPELIKEQIMAGHSISLQFPEYHFYTSAIVGGIIPIALGVAMTGQTCWVFVGDMGGTTGIFYECVKYARRHELNITFIVEDNSYSVETPTNQVWGDGMGEPNIIDYVYERTYPHQGSGKWVTF